MLARSRNETKSIMAIVQNKASHGYWTTVNGRTQNDRSRVGSRPWAAFGNGLRRVAPSKRCCLFEADSLGREVTCLSTMSPTDGAQSRSPFDDIASRGICPGRVTLASPWSIRRHRELAQLFPNRWLAQRPCHPGFPGRPPRSEKGAHPSPPHVGHLMTSRSHGRTSSQS